MRGFQHIRILLFLFSSSLAYERHIKRILNDSTEKFHCINNQYIRASFFCDEMNDCTDGSDEAYGCDVVKCGSGNFICQADSKCLDISVRCNKKSDCIDDSDEQYCFHEPPIENCTITMGKFLCNDKTRCIDLSRVCDEEPHCSDGSDEGGKCDDYDHEQCNNCDHACYRTPIGPHCFHNSNAKYFDVFMEIKECSPDKNDCEQKCVSYHEVNQCSCEENFVPMYTPFKSFYCEEKEKSRNWLFYLVKGAVKGIKGYKNQSSEIISETKDTISAIAAGNEFVYWGRSNEKIKVIEKASLRSLDSENGTIKTVIVNFGIKEINAMDVDWRTGNVYFIDNGNKHIAACRNDGRLCIVVTSLEDIGTSIALAPRQGIMFWSMRNKDYGFVIRKSDMNGQSAYDFINEGLYDIYSITCDEASEKLYWLDSLRRKIEVIRFNGEGKKIFKSDLRMEYLYIAINARYLYWLVNNTASSTNRNIRNTIYFSPQTRVIPESVFNESEPVLKIYGYSYSTKTTTMQHPCSWGCDNGICLISSHYYNKTKAECVCSNLTDQQMDNWCHKNADSFFNQNYNYYEEYYPEGQEHLKPVTAHYTLSSGVICASILTVVSVISFYLYRLGCFQGVDLFRRVRFYELFI